MSYGKYLLAMFTLLMFAHKALALPPALTSIDIINSFPEYPNIDYGSGAARASVMRGEYLAKLGDCIACHTAKPAKGQNFAGGLPLATPFGTFYSPNITPDKETGIGNWSEQDFIRAMRKGVRADGSNSFPVFPYVYFNRLKEQDLKDLWVYLQKIPAVSRENKVTTAPFPFNWRLTQLPWKWLFFYPDEGVYEDDPSQSEEWNRGAYLVQGLGHCGMCHSPLNLLGAEEKDYFLTGGMIEGYWAPDITSAGLADASRFQVADVFVEDKLINNAGKVRGPMAEANHDSLGFLTDSDQLAIATYLKTLTSEQPRPLEKSLATQEPLKRGQQVYANVCKICHLDGEAGAPRIDDHANWQYRLKTNGLNALYSHAVEGYNKMPVKGACLSCTDDEIEDAVDYMLYHALSHNEWQGLKHPNAADRPRSTRIALGETVYQQHCSHCHDTGKGGAPKRGDKSLWAKLAATDTEKLFANTLKGTQGMPAMGGCTTCSNSEVIAAVKYLLQESQEGKNYTLW